jgi:hypothetical protein
LLRDVHILLKNMPGGGISQCNFCNKKKYRKRPEKRGTCEIKWKKGERKRENLS